MPLPKPPVQKATLLSAQRVDEFGGGDTEFADLRAAYGNLMHRLHRLVGKGLAAAVYGASEGLSVLVLESNVPGGQAGTSCWSG